jgi:SAM-dependent methyltransferase
MFERFRQRSDKLELIDTGDYTPTEYENCLAELRTVNRWLGDVSALRRSVIPALERDTLDSFSVLDVGAGSGELLRVVANWARENHRSTVLVGLELNQRSAMSIEEQSRGFEEIRSVRGNALQMPFADNSFDYVICSLFTHHFRDEGVVAVLREMKRIARRCVYVIDLHRHPIAYFFYRTIGRILLHNRLVREDGALSILRAFVPSELFSLAVRAGLNEPRVVRRFPYRLVLSGGVE